MSTVQICEVLEQYSERPPVGSNPEVLTLTEKNGFVRQSDRFNKRLATEDVSAYKHIGRGTIAFNPYLLWAGAIAHNKQWDSAVISPLYPTFKVRDGFDDNYVKRILLTPEMIKKYDSIAFGSVPRRRRSSVADFLSLRIPAPPRLEGQRRIAEVLDQVDTLREQRRKAISLLDDLAQSIFVHAFGNLSDIVDTLPLGQLADVSSGITKGRKISDGTTLRTVPYLAVLNVQDKRFDLQVVKTIDATDLEVDRYRLLRDDLLLTEGGDPDKLGRGSLWQEEIVDCIHQNHIFRVRLRDATRVRPLFLNWVVSSAYGKSYFLKSAKQTTGIASINATQLRNFPVPLPSVELQAAFEKQLRRVQYQLVAQNEALSEADALFASVQSRAFRGELWQDGVNDLVGEGVS